MGSTVLQTQRQSSVSRESSSILQAQQSTAPAKPRPIDTVPVKISTAVPKSTKKTTTVLKRYPDFLPFLASPQFQPNAVVMDIKQVHKDSSNCEKCQQMMTNTESRIID